MVLLTIDAGLIAVVLFLLKGNRPSQNESEVRSKNKGKAEAHVVDEKVNEVERATRDKRYGTKYAAKMEAKEAKKQEREALIRVYMKEKWTYGSFRY